MECEAAMHRAQQRWTLPQGMQVPALLRAKPAPVSGESIWVFFPAEKAEQSAEKFLAADKTSVLPGWRWSEGQWSRLILPLQKEFKGGYLQGEKRVIEEE